MTSVQLLWYAAPESGEARSAQRCSWILGLQGRCLCGGPAIRSEVVELYLAVPPAGRELSSIGERATTMALTPGDRQLEDFFVGGQLPKEMIKQSR